MNWPKQYQDINHISIKNKKNKFDNDEELFTEIKKLKNIKENSRIPLEDNTNNY